MAYVDFTTFTEVDPNSDITLTSDTCSFDTLDNGANAWVYKDEGVDFFDGDFNHEVQVKITGQTGGYGRAMVWSLTNTITDFKSCSDGLGVAFNHRGGNRWIELYERNSSTEYSDYGNYTENTDYYLTIERDESIGTYGRIYCYIYSDSNRTTLLDTLQLDLHEKVDFRYIFCLQRLGGAGSGSTYTGYVKNLNLPYIHSGDITSNETWTLASSPHIVTDHLYIKSGAQVTIEAGCQVQVDASKKIEIQSGSIVAVGTLGNEIIFTKNTANNWEKLYSYATNTYGNLNDFRYCIFEYIDGNIDFRNYAPAYFDNNTVQYISYYGGLVFLDFTSDFTCNNLTIAHDISPSGYTPGLQVKNCQTVTFNDLEVYDITALLNQATPSQGSTKVIYNRLKCHDFILPSGNNDAIDIQQSTEINYGLFYDFPGNVDHVIKVFSTGSVTVTNCTFYDGDSAIYVFQAGATAVVRNCIFHTFTGNALRQLDGTLTSRYNWFYNCTGNYLGTVDDKTGDNTSETDPELLTGTGETYEIYFTSPCATAGEGSPYEDYMGYSAPIYPYPYHYESETVTLTDAIELNLTLAKQEESDTVTLNDEINVAFLIQQESSDILALSDNLDIMLSRELSETLTLADAITIDTVEPSVNDINNIFGMVNGTIEDIDNKFGMLAESKSDINNKVGFLQSWQVPGDAGYQSLGKEYVKVYINSVEQTDVDVDSITITKSLNSPHTASFLLGRPYDNTKPDMELSVEIKYHIWTLYKGYVTQINPTNSPDSIRITCQDKYWKRNKTKKYFFVGHRPQDNRELYYNSISEGLSACGASFDVGGFVPQTISLFGTGESDAISNLVTNAGNFGWYYDINETKKLWQAGKGDIVYLERQEIDKNLGLYQVIRHSFRESIEGIVNKFRVQIGNFVWRRFNDRGGSKEQGTRKVYVTTTLTPAWDATYERLASDDYNPETQVGTSGVFNHTVDENDLYKDVFTKYSIPTYWLYKLGLGEEPTQGWASWTDEFPPELEAERPGFNYKSSLGIFGTWELKKGMEGFTVDYETGEVTLNQPAYLFQSDETGKMVNARAHSLTLYLWKKENYSHTEDPSDDPTSDISNPLMFFTPKMGDYPETIMENLSLNGLGIQIGGWYVLERDGEGRPLTYRYIPSWDDTNFAKDYANWQLSKKADKKIIGTIEITIDSVCFYNINLSNRIMIDGVIENPLNIVSISYNIGGWRVALGLENGRYYKRSVSLQSRGE